MGFYLAPTRNKEKYTWLARLGGGMVQGTPKEFIHLNCFKSCNLQFLPVATDIWRLLNRPFPLRHMWNAVYVMSRLGCLGLRCVKDWVRKRPSSRYAKIYFVNNSTSIPLMGYLISTLFKSRGSNRAPPTFGIT